MAKLLKFSLPFEKPSLHTSELNCQKNQDKWRNTKVNDVHIASLVNCILHSNGIKFYHVARLDQI